MAKGCKICHALTLELDATGRCLGCAMAKAATDAGTTYGKFVARRYVGSVMLPLLPLELEPEEPVDDAPTPKPKKAAKKTPVMRTCVYCGKEYRRITGNQRFCCHECQEAQHRIDARNRMRAKANNQGRRYCVVCGKPIPEEQHLLKNTCSEECRIARHNEKAREGAARQREREAAQRG